MWYENMQQLYRKTPMPKCDFNKVAKQLIKIALFIGCSPVILLHISKASFTKNTSKWLLLYWSRGPSVEIDFQSRPLKVCTRSYTCKRKKLCHADVIFSSNPVKNSYEKHFGMFLDTKFDFDEHFKGVFNKTSKSIGLIRKPQNFFTRPSLL